jgi:hypothetical protein
MLALTHDPLVGAGVDGAAVVGATVGAAVDGATVGAAVDGAFSHSAPLNPGEQTQTFPLQLPFPEHTVVLLAGEALFGPEMLAATHDAEVGAGVWLTGVSVGAAVVGAAVDGASVDSMHATSHSSPSKPALQTQVAPSQTPFPLQTADCLSKFIKRLAGEALFGPEMFAEQEAEVLFALLPGVALFGPEMFAPHWLVAFTAMMAANRAMSTIVLII